MAENDACAITEDALLDGRLRLRQPARGYRAGADALLLAAALEPAEGASVFEPGCGVGAAMLALAVRRPDLRVLGMEIDPVTATLAADNVRLNGLEAQVSVKAGDALRDAAGVFDAILLNPPFATPTGAPEPVDPQRRRAFVTPDAIDVWIRRLADRLTGGGVMTIVHRADALPALIAALDGRLGGVEVAPVYPRAGEAAHRVLVRAVKGSRAALRLWRGLQLHADAGGFTDEAEAIFRGRATFTWR